MNHERAVIASFPGVFGQSLQQGRAFRMITAVAINELLSTVGGIARFAIQSGQDESKRRFSILLLFVVLQPQSRFDGRTAQPRPEAVRLIRIEFDGLSAKACCVVEPLFLHGDRAFMPQSVCRFLRRFRMQSEQQPQVIHPSFGRRQRGQLVEPLVQRRHRFVGFLNAVLMKQHQRQLILQVGSRGWSAGLVFRLPRRFSRQ